MSVPAVQCTGVTKRFPHTSADALHEFDLSAEAGSILALLGPSGSGKTTALRIIAGFEAPDSGTVEIDGRLVAGPGRFVRADRRKIGMVFQEYALFPHLTVAANVGFGIEDRSVRGQRVSEALAHVGLTGLDARMPHELSGGQQQRVALARALCPQPSVLLLDEPFSNLDEALRKQVRREVRDILKFTGTTALFVTHDQDEALFMGDRVAVLDQGMLQQVATPEEIYHTPGTRFVAEFIGIGDFLPVHREEGRLTTVAGTLPWPSETMAEGAEVLLRPDDLTISPSESGQGIISDRQFQGSTYLYEVALEIGRTVRVMQHHTRQYDVGTKVDVRLIAEHRMACFVGGERVE
ncbi:MAG: ABC transporter ATP-binding protein [Chloroflexota bacterium]|nr:ABC transporter ATP-binding protein [Chloroflexota bacterium]